MFPTFFIFTLDLSPTLRYNDSNDPMGGLFMAVCTYHANDLSPLWQGQQVYRETVMFIGAADKAPLLYPPTEILSVTDYGGEVIYELGKDLVLNADGSLSLTKDTRIPFITEEAYYHNDPSSLISIPHNGKDTYIYWGEGTTMTKWQIAVTYAHNFPSVISKPTCFSHRYATFFEKLQNGKDVSVFFYGDSITVGGNCSYLCNTPPHMPSWTMLVTEYLATRYGFSHHYIDTGLERAMPVPKQDTVKGSRGTLTYLNTAYGGWNSTQGIAGLEERVVAPILQHGCDLFVLAHGMNDKRLSPEEYIEKQRVMIDRVLDVAPNTSFLLVATMYANPASPRWNINQPLFEAPLKALADEYNTKGVPCAVVPVTSLSAQVLSRKRFCDCSGNNINHPNDFLVRLYAQAALQTLLGDQ